MPRLVVPMPGPAAAAARIVADKGDDYPDRVAKYIPGEIIAGYLAIIGFLESASPDDFWLVKPTTLFVFNRIHAEKSEGAAAD